MKVCFIIGSPDIGGGTYVIYQHALYLKRVIGWQVDIVPMFEATEENIIWHPEAAKYLTFTSFKESLERSYDFAIITWWKTAYEAWQVRAERYIYFVQSIESWFYPSSEVPLRKLVEATYECGLPVITEATWIKNHLYCHYGTEAALVKNGIRKKLYKPYGPVKAERVSGKLRVLVEGPIDVDFKNVPKTIELCRQSDADEIWLLTSTKLDSYQGVDKVFSRVPITETAEIYRSCDVLVKLSYVEGMFGPPLEMFHCGGTAIVYNVTGHDEYIHHNMNGMVVMKEAERDVIKYLNRLKSDKHLLKSLQREAVKTAMDWFDWPTSSQTFYKELVNFSGKLPITGKKILFDRLKQSFAAYVEEEGNKKSVK